MEIVVEGTRYVRGDLQSRTPGQAGGGAERKPRAFPEVHLHRAWRYGIDPQYELPRTTKGAGLRQQQVSGTAEPGTAGCRPGGDGNRPSTSRLRNLPVSKARDSSPQKRLATGVDSNQQGRGRKGVVGGLR